MNVFVYILECADGAYYVGTHRGDDLDVRIGEHNSGKYTKAWTYKRRPVRLAWCVCYDDPVQAVLLERQLKGWSRAKKAALIRGDHAALVALSRSRTSREANPEGLSPLHPSTGSG